MNEKFKKIFDIIHLKSKATIIENRLDLVDLIIKNKKNIPNDLHEVLVLWRNNVEKQLSSGRNNAHMIITGGDPLSTAIDRSMAWGDTPEGMEFWGNYGPYRKEGHPFKSTRLKDIITSYNNICMPDE